MSATKLTNWYVALLPSSATLCRCFQYTNFVLQGKNVVNKATDGCVRTFDTWCRVVQSAPEQSQLCELSGPSSGQYGTRHWSNGPRADGQAQGRVSSTASWTSQIGKLSYLLHPTDLIFKNCTCTCYQQAKHSFAHTCMYVIISTLHIHLVAHLHSHFTQLCQCLLQSQWMQRET